MAFAMAGLIFLRFWRRSRDRLFLLFALAFFILALNRIGLATAFQQGYRRDTLYWVRLVAFLLILLAIVDKNRARRPSRSVPRTDPDKATAPVEDER